MEVFGEGTDMLLLVGIDRDQAADVMSDWGCPNPQDCPLKWQDQF